MVRIVRIIGTMRFHFSFNNFVICGMTLLPHCGMHHLHGVVATCVQAGGPGGSPPGIFHFSGTIDVEFIGVTGITCIIQITGMTNIMSIAAVVASLALCGLRQNAIPCSH